MATSLDLKRRIKSVSNTRKITKAMELVSASKMRKAVRNVIATRDYANMAWTTIVNISQKTESKNHPLLEKRPVKKVALLLISSNRGLCGGFNANIAQKAIDSIRKHEKNVQQTEIITLGKKGRDSLIRSKFTIAADFKKEDLITSIMEISSIAHMLIEGYRRKEYDKVMVAYTDFVSSLNQIPRVKQLLPIDIESDEEYLGVVGKSSFIGTDKGFVDEKIKKQLSKKGFEYDYTFEPSAGKVLEEMLPRLIEMQIYQAVLESDAAEHSSRMVSMKNASDSAKDMISDLTLIYNRVRQAGITREISEISAGKAALE